MREIKFRCWYKNNWEFETPQEMEYFTFDELCDSDSRGNDEFEWMQYTGLKDKNGKEIYEGDYIAYKEGNEDGLAEIKGFNGSLVFWWHKQNTPSPSMFDATYYFGYAGALEVIGNIYENANLLEDL